ncbi:MAG: PIG-L family deacetylase [Clostridia bacterium]|nr:PIG-L family deacetylase [Clostridia bacterium]
MNVLAIGCHPDDAKIACAVTLAKCVKRGDKVIVCYVSTGNLGHVIITHNPDDYMPNHTAVSRLVFDASFTATLPNYTDYPHVYSSNDGEPAKLVSIYYMDTLAGVNFNPSEHVDISDVIDLKIQMLECHESQLVWMREHDVIDFADMVKTCSRYRGYQCGAEYAEGFRQCQAYLKGTTKRLLP